MIRLGGGQEGIAKVWRKAASCELALEQPPQVGDAGMYFFFSFSSTTATEVW